MTQARSARAINRTGEKRGSVTYSTDRENEVSKILLYLYFVSDGFGNDSSHEERLQNF